MNQPRLPEVAQNSKLNPVLLSLDGVLTQVSENLHDLDILEKTITELTTITTTDLAVLRASDLSDANRDQAELVLQKLHQLEQKLHLRGSILAGFSLKLKELIEG